ncbi:MAG: hypothetical protein KGL68_16420 [Burkholderiales bacterium]|nr:hypothetical protein [Burkholderiales bacterium]
MSVSAIRWGAALVAIMGLQAACGVRAQDTPTYKCVARGRVTYSQIPCAPGARELGERHARVSMRYETPPQDRAKAERRAELPADARAECSALDSRMAAQRAQLKSLGATATLHDEMPLVQSKKRYRELHC